MHLLLWTSQVCPYLSPVLTGGRLSSVGGPGAQSISHMSPGGTAGPSWRSLLRGFPAPVTKRSPRLVSARWSACPQPQHCLASVLPTCLCPIHLVAVPGVGGQGRPVPGTQQTPHKCCRSGQTTARLCASCSPGRVTGAAPQTQQPPADRGGQRVTSSPCQAARQDPECTFLSQHRRERTAAGQDSKVWGSPRPLSGLRNDYGG